MYFDCFIFERFLEEGWLLVVRTFIFPASNIEVVGIVTLGFAFFCLVFLAEVTTTALVA